MYTLTFNRATINDLLDHRTVGRQLYAAIVIPNSGVFTRTGAGNSVQIPKIVCPYQVNDIIAIQEQWARSNYSYVYKTGSDSTDAGYFFRPAVTMPVEAARMYARIVSITPWPVTTDILNNYLTIGLMSDGYAGAAKVIDYFDEGTRLLSKTRAPHNRKVLNQSAQPMVYSDPPMVQRSVYYYLKEDHFYQLYPSTSSEFIWGPTTSVAQAADYSKIIKYGSSTVTVDRYHGKWALATRNNKDEQYVSDTDRRKLQYIGEASWSTEENPAYIYVVFDNKGYAIPQYATYKTFTIDPTLRWYCWMISAYLSDKKGNIIGNWF